MKEWYLITPQPTFNSQFESDDFYDYTADGFEEVLYETPLGKDIILCKGRFDGENFETEVEDKGVVQNETGDSQSNGWKRQLLVRRNTIGDYKYIKYNSLIYIIMTEPSNNRIYEKVVMYQCNIVGKWQNGIGEILQLPFCCSNASQYNTGESGNKTLTLGYNQLSCYISMDEDTLQLNRKNRMFLDYNTENPTPYRIVRSDTVSYSYGKSRLIFVIFEEDQYNPETDSIEEWICDYRPMNIPLESGFSIICKGGYKIRCGSSKVFTVDASFEITAWYTELNDIQSEYITTEIDGNEITVTCGLNRDIINTVFTLNCENSEGETASVEITIVGGV